MGRDDERARQFAAAVNAGDLNASVAHLSMTSVERRAAMIEACRSVAGVPGDIVECGVFKGANIILARKLLPDRVCWLYDTFTGMTLPDEIDVSVSSGNPAVDRYNVKMDSGTGWCRASLDDVRDNLLAAGVLHEDRLRFVAGDVNETLRISANVPDRIALLRLDTDWYASTRTELEVLYPRLSPGGVLIVDDYGHWMGARRAVDEYFGGSVELTKIDYTAVMMVKPAC